MSEFDVRNYRGNNYTVRRIVNYILGVLEILLAFRFVFKLFVANPNSQFATLIYNITKGIVSPFTAVFDPYILHGAKANTVVEFSTLIAMVVFALLAWGLIKLFVILKITD